MQNVAPDVGSHGKHRAPSLVTVPCAAFVATRHTVRLPPNPRPALGRRIIPILQMGTPRYRGQMLLSRTMPSSGGCLPDPLGPPQPAPCGERGPLLQPCLWAHPRYLLISLQIYTFGPNEEGKAGAGLTFAAERFPASVRPRPHYPAAGARTASMEQRAGSSREPGLHEGTAGAVHLS